MAVDIDATQQFEPGIPKTLFQIRVPNGAAGRPSYAVTRDGQRFLLAAEPGRGLASAPLNVIVNWLAAVQK